MRSTSTSSKRQSGPWGKMYFDDHRLFVAPSIAVLRNKWTTSLKSSNEENRPLRYEKFDSGTPLAFSFMISIHRAHLVASSPETVRT